MFKPVKKLSIKIGLIMVCLTIVGGLYASRSTWYRRDVFGGVQIFLLENNGTTTQKGAEKFGSNEDTPTLPTTSNADSFSMKVPFLNVSGSTMLKGMVVLTTSGTINAANQIAWGTVAAVNSTTTILGINDASLAANATGWMSIAGYAVVLTTTAIRIGDLLVSTIGANGAGNAGYAGVTTGTQVVGTDIGIAVSSNSNGGNVVVRLR